MLRTVVFWAYVAIMLRANSHVNEKTRTAPGLLYTRDPEANETNGETLSDYPGGMALIFRFPWFDSKDPRGSLSLRLIVWYPER